MKPANLFLSFWILFNFISYGQSVFVGAGASLTSNRHSVYGHTNEKLLFQHDYEPVTTYAFLAGYETVKWKGFSANATITEYLNKIEDLYYSRSYTVSCIGVNLNYYILQKKNEFYIGAGPRIDAIDVWSMLLGNQSPEQEPVENFVFGLTGSLGFNFRINDHNYLGLKANYLWQSKPFYYFDFNYVPNEETGLGPDLNDEKIRAQSVNLQVVYTYRF